MKKIIVAIIMVLALLCGFAMAEQSTRLNTVFESGSFIVQIEDAQDMGWYATPGDDIVSLYDADVLEDTFVARYDPIADGTTTVAVQHFYNACACDEQFTFDLLVKDGQVQEVTGGSHTNNLDDDALDPYLVGAWACGDAQMTVEKNPARVWDVEIVTSDYRFVATLYQDCVSDTLVYDKGKRFENGQTEAEVTAGAFKLTEDGLAWDGMTFTRILPRYTYSEANTPVAAVCDYLVTEIAKDYDPADVSIPYMAVFDIDETDSEDVTVLGDFNLYNYKLEGETLLMVSGGAYPGKMHLVKDGDGYKVTSFDVVEDGEDYSDSVKDIFGDHADDLFEAQGQLEQTRIEYMVDYIRRNELPVTAYQDYGWEPVDLTAFF